MRNSLENLASRFPGIELNMELYRNLYSFPLDDFQERGLAALIEGNNVVVSTPTGSGMIKSILYILIFMKTFV